MSNYPWTPGPWVADRPEVCGPESDFGVWTEDAGPICYVGDPYERGDNNPVENMRLIAAAPDLYAALDALLGCDSVCDFHRQLATAAMRKAIDPDEAPAP
jgi:hypothetical protein